MLYAYIEFGQQKEAQEMATILLVQLPNFNIDAAEIYYPLQLDKD